MTVKNENCNIENNMYNEFKLFNEDLFNSYNEKVVKLVFSEVLSFVKNENIKTFTSDDIVQAIQAGLKKHRLACIAPIKLVESIMDYISFELGIIKDSYDNHFEMLRKIVWRSLSVHINNAAVYSDSLANAIIKNFSDIDVSGEISTLSITEKLLADNRFKSLPIEIVNDVVNFAYDYYKEKGFII